MDSVAWLRLQTTPARLPSLAFLASRYIPPACSFTYLDSPLFPSLT